MKTFWVSFMIGSMLLCYRNDLFAQDESSAALKLDSILWTAYWPDSSEFKDLERWKFKYDKNKDASEAYYFIYDAYAENFVPEIRAQFSYNEYHSPENGDFYQYYQWDLEWDKSYQLIFTYDSRGLLIQKKLNSWQEELEFWYDNVKFNYEYDSSDNLTLITSYLCAEMINGKATKWKAYGKNSFSYDSSGSLFQNDIYERWGDDTLSPWLLEDRKEYSYYPEGYSILHTDYLYNLNTPAGHSENKFDFFYNSSGDVSFILGYLRDESNGQWKYLLRKNFTYETDLGAGQLIIPTNHVLNENTIIHDFTFDLFTHKVNEMTCDRYSYEQWIPDYKGVFYYSDISQSNTQSLQSMGLEIYPNPTKDFIIVKWNSELPSLHVIIYDIWGRAVLSSEVENSSTIDLGRLSEGMYIFQFQKGNRKVLSKKVFVL